MIFSDEDLMVVALSEAAKVHKRDVLPNPRVGAAILAKGNKLFFGHHKKSGKPHAELEAIDAARSAGADLRGATIAVTLEPCSHHGKTPPCAEALIKEGFARVLIGVQDTDARVDGRGIAVLREAGIEVVCDLLKDRAIEINKEWLYAKAHSLPYVYLKMATSLDGLWTAEDGISKWITGLDARTHAHDLRNTVGAIVTSFKTIATDDPQFNARDEHQAPLARQPDLVVVSRQSKWGEGWDKGVYQAQSVKGREVHEWHSDDLEALLAEIYVKGHMSCMIEAGPELSSVFLNAGLVQEIWHYQGARYLGGNGERLRALAKGQLPGIELRVQETRTFRDGDSFVRSLVAQSADTNL